MEILLLCLLAVVLWVLIGALGITINFSTFVSGFASASEGVALSDSEGIIANPTVPAAQPAVLTTHTTNTSGTLTMTNTSHGITTGQRVDIYWSGGQCYGAIVGTVSGTTVPIASVSGGSNLPSSSTPVTIGIATSVSFGLTGNNLTALVLQTPQTGYFVFNNGSSDVYAAYVTGGYVAGWKTGDTGTNPLASTTPTLVYMSHNSTTAALSGSSGMIASALTH